MGAITVVEGVEIENREAQYSLIDFKGTDFKAVDIATWFYIAKANKGFGEPGITYDEMRALHEAVETLGKRPLTSFETGMCFGTSTRYFAIRVAKYGGEHYPCEIVLRSKFVDAMKEVGLWNYINVVNGNSMLVNWQKELDVLFIDSEHALSDALGEYMRYRVWLRGGGIVGFHDYDVHAGVQIAIDIAQHIDKLKKVSESTNKAGAGIIFFQLEAKGTMQDAEGLGRLRKDGYQFVASRG